LSRAIEHSALKDSAADLTSVPDNLLDGVIERDRPAKSLAGEL
jgi:hypothetical protein